MARQAAEPALDSPLTMRPMLLVPIEVRHSSIHGLGVFATAFVPKGTVIWQFDPGIDRHLPADWVRAQPPHVQRFVQAYAVLAMDQQSYTLTGDQTLFVNHSPAGNMTPHPRIQMNGEEVVVAARDIQVGEELTINYGEIDGADRAKLSRGLPLFS
jgi:hypothetical protein